jgi:DNA-binding cell septation regulator SpoVG
VGSNLTFRVLSLPTKAVIQEMTVSDTTFAAGFTGLFVDMPSNNPASHEVILDNFFVTGTRP